MQRGLLFFMVLIALGSSACISSSKTSSTIPPSSLPAPQSSSPTPLAPTARAVPLYTYQIVHVYPHDPAAFTEGLIYDNGFLYESTGLGGSSSLRRVDLETGKILQLYDLPGQYFGEGLTVLQDKLIQLTYTSHIGFVYDKDNFDLQRTFTYATEGWGLTYDGQRLIMSDGTSNLYFLDPETERLTGSVEVLDGNVPVTSINDVEYVKGEIYANIFPADKIAIINPQSGMVTGWIDLAGLLQTQNYNGQVDVLNGIAYDSRNDRLFVTGKLWPYLFEIKLMEINPSENAKQ